MPLGLSDRIKMVLWPGCEGRARCSLHKKKNVRTVRFVVKTRGCCCNLFAGVALNVRFTTNGMWAKNNTIYMWREQAIIEWSRRVISIVACCHSVKLCAHAALAFRSQQNGAVTRMWRSCQVQTSQKEHAIGAIRCENEGIFFRCSGLLLALYNYNGLAAPRLTLYKDTLWFKLCTVPWVLNLLTRL